MVAECSGEDQATCNGLNKFEASAIETMMSHWQDLEEVGANIDLTNLTSSQKEQLNLINLYGVGDRLMVNVLVSFWNNPEKFRATIYEGNGSTVKSAVSNLAIIFSASNELFKEESDRVLSRDVVGHARRISPCLLYTSPSPRDQRGSRMPSSA